MESKPNVFRDKQRRRNSQIGGLAVTLVAISAQPASAMDGNELWRYCEPQPAISANEPFCYGFVTGTLETYANIYDTGPMHLCLPDSMVRGQAVDVVRKYLRDEPSQRHYGASSLVWTAMFKAFPCPTKK